MKSFLWKSLFCFLDIFIKNDAYIKFKSKKLPQNAYFKGYSTTVDSQLKLSKHFSVVPNQQILFFKLKKTDTLFEIKEIVTHNQTRYYLVSHPLSGNEFYLTVDTFNLFFYPYQNKPFNLNVFGNQAKK